MASGRLGSQDQNNHEKESKFKRIMALIESPANDKRWGRFKQIKQH